MTHQQGIPPEQIQRQCSEELIGKDNPIYLKGVFVEKQFYFKVFKTTDGDSELQIPNRCLLTTQKSKY